MGLVDFAKPNLKTLPTRENIFPGGGWNRKVGSEILIKAAPRSVRFIRENFPMG